MIYIFIIFLTIAISQTIKFIFRYFSATSKINKGILWTYLWATGAPSTHAAGLSAGLVMLYEDIGFSSLFAFCMLVAIIIMYNLVADRKREGMRQIAHNSVSYAHVLDISGHTFFDIITGVLVGIMTALLFLPIVN